MNNFNIGDLNVKYPIIQGGMGIAISLSGLASAVANEGGIGVISGVGIGMTEPDYKTNFHKANKRALKKEIRKARSLTDGVLGVNIMMALTDFDDLFYIAVEEGIDVIFVGAGLPLKVLDLIPKSILEKSKTKIVPKVSSARATNLILKYWANKYNTVPDAFALEGPKAGGHLGFRRTELIDDNIPLSALVEEAVEIIKPYEEQFGKEIPLIAAGGIYTGKDIYDIMQSGAKAVKMGTRFVTTHECDASIEFKESYLDCNKDDIEIIDSPVGLPGRVIHNNFISEMEQGNKKPFKCHWKCLKTCNYKEVPYCIAQALFNAADGKMSEGFAFAGSNAYKAKEITSVRETMNEIITEYDMYNQINSIIEPQLQEV